MDHGMEYVTLNNRVKMPKLGFGVFQIAKSFLLLRKYGSIIMVMKKQSIPYWIP